MIRSDHRASLAVALPVCGTFTMLLAVGVAAAEPIYYSFGADPGSGQAGGVAVIEVDEESGALIRHTTLFRHADFTHAGKVAACGVTGVVVALGKSASAGVFLAPAGSDPRELLVSGPDAPGLAVTVSSLPATPEELCVAGGRAYISTDDGHLVAIDLASGEVVRRWNSRKALSPPGHKIEDLSHLGESGLLVASLQKDQKNQKSLGNRLVVFSSAGMEVVADHQLDRSRPELHLSDDPDRKQLGPGPEVVFSSLRHGVLGVTLDLYGAVALMSTHELGSGGNADVLYIPVGKNDTWGDAFPDRACVIGLEDADFAAIFNAGPSGGIAIIGLEDRRSTAWVEAPGGLESPVFVHAARRVAAAHAGKRKERRPTSIEISSAPSARLVWLIPPEPADTVDVGDGATAGERGGTWRTEETTLPGNALWVSAVNSALSPFVVAFCATQEGEHLLCVVEARTGAIVGTHSAMGRPGRAATAER